MTHLLCWCSFVPLIPCPSAVLVLVYASALLVLAAHSSVLVLACIARYMAVCLQVTLVLSQPTRGLGLGRPHAVAVAAHSSLAPLLRLPPMGSALAFRVPAVQRHLECHAHPPQLFILTTTTTAAATITITTA